MTTDSKSPSQSEASLDDTNIDMTKREIPPTGSFGRTTKPRRSNELETLLSSIVRPASARLRELRPIASGGMGAVVEVHDVALERVVARKTIHSHVHDPRAVLSFLREARVTGQLEHPHIVPVHEVGVGADGRLFFTMKRVEGVTLRALLRSLPEGPLSHHTLIDLIDIVVNVCQALAFAHNRGVLHLDVKASNVMVGDFGEVYLMDWGVARIVEEKNGDAPTDSGSRVRSTEPSIETKPVIVGTPSYMSPQQAMGDDDALDGRADVFAVGAMLYEILTRRPPYQGATVMETLLQAAHGHPPPIDELLGPGAVPPELARIVKKAMSPVLDERYGTMDALREDLVRFSRGGGEFPRRTYEAGEVITRQGDPGDEAFFIVSGRCEVLIGDRRIREMGAGEAFGEMSILSEGTRTATVQAVERTVVEVINAAVFDRELDSMKPWMSVFVRTLAERFREREALALDGRDPAATEAGAKTGAETGTQAETDPPPKAPSSTPPIDDDASRAS